MFLGIEIGGTKLQAALGNGDGTIHKIQSVRANPAAGREGITQQVKQLVADLLAQADIPANQIKLAGIGFGGPVQPSQGIVLKSHQVHGWDDFPIVDWFEKTTSVPACLGNDSDLAGLAEAHFGVGKGHARVVYMNVGSGIGGAIVIDGQIYTSQGAGASEIGHMRIFPADHGKPWITLEELASGWSLAKYAARLAKLEPQGKIAKIAGDNPVTTEILVEAVRQQDPSATDFWYRSIKYLAVAVANVITLLRPEIFAIGGGVPLAGDIFFDPLRKEVQRQVFLPYRDSYQILPAKLRETVVLHGALKLAKQHHARQS